MSDGERRQEKRITARGEVSVWLDDPEEPMVRGRLLDVSPHGFRLSHQSKRIIPGCQVRLTHLSGEVTARALWNRVIGDQIETGFLVL